MRRSAPLLLFFLAFGCASAQPPNGSADLTHETGGNDDADAAGAGLASGDVPSSVDDSAAARAIDSVDAAAESPISNADATGDALVAALAVPPFDAGEGGTCSGPVAPGDLVIDELMIESVAGSGDHGEWLEVESTVGCAVNLRGLHGDAPNGNKVRVFDVGSDIWIPAFGRFVVADSSNASINHALPGPLIFWSGQPGDVLRNKGTTVTLHMSGLVIDVVTYPSLALTAGVSIAFPSDCDASRRSDWTAWQTSTASWFPGFYGTPNAPNTDVQCP